MSDASSLNLLPNQDLKGDWDINNALGSLSNFLKAPIQELKDGRLEIGIYKFDFTPYFRGTVVCTIKVKLEKDNFERICQLHDKQEVMSLIPQLTEDNILDSNYFVKDHYDYDFEDDQSMPSEI